MKTRILVFVSALGLLTISLLTGCGQEEAGNNSVSSTPIRFFENPDVILQLQEKVSSSLRKEIPLAEKNILATGGEYYLLRIPSDCLPEMNDLRTENPAKVQLQSEELSYANSAFELDKLTAGWYFHKRSRLVTMHDLNPDQTKEYSLSSTNGLDVITLQFPHTPRKTSWDIKCNGKFVVRNQRIETNSFTLPYGFLRRGENNLQISFTADDESVSRVRLGGIYSGDDRSIILKTKNRFAEEGLILSYNTYPDDMLRPIQFVLGGGALRSEGFPHDTPLFNLVYRSLDNTINIAKRSSILFSGQSVNWKGALPDYACELQFFYSFNKGEQPPGSSLNLTIESIENPDKKRIYSTAIDEIGRLIWYQQTIDLSDFSGEKLSLRFTYDSPTSEKSEQASIFWGEPVLVASNQPQNTRKNVILISLDTFRGDRLSANGWKRETTPFLDRYAKNWGKFQQCLFTRFLDPPLSQNNAHRASPYICNVSLRQA
jgi:hypothetical protein